MRVARSPLPTCIVWCGERDKEVGVDVDNHNGHTELQSDLRIAFLQAVQEGGTIHAKASRHQP